MLNLHFNKTLLPIKKVFSSKFTDIKLSYQFPREPYPLIRLLQPTDGWQHNGIMWLALRSFNSILMLTLLIRSLFSNVPDLILFYIVKVPGIEPVASWLVLRYANPLTIRPMRHSKYNYIFGLRYLLTDHDCGTGVASLFLEQRIKIKFSVGSISDWDFSVD